MTIPSTYIETIGRKPVQSYFYIHDLEPNPTYRRLGLKDAISHGTLKVPTNLMDPEVGSVEEPYAQRFRVPTVVWH